MCSLLRRVISFAVGLGAVACSGNETTGDALVTLDSAVITFSPRVSSDTSVRRWSAMVRLPEHRAFDRLRKPTTSYPAGYVLVVETAGGTSTQSLGTGLKSKIAGARTWLELMQGEPATHVEIPADISAGLDSGCVTIRLRGNGTVRRVFGQRRRFVELITFGRGFAPIEYKVPRVRYVQR